MTSIKLTAAQVAQQTNRHRDGKYATKVHGEDGMFVEPDIPGEAVLSFDDVTAKYGYPAEETRTEAKRVVMAGVSWMQTRYSWDQLMPGKRRTEANIERYWRAKEQAILDNPDDRDTFEDEVDTAAHHLNERAAVVRAYEAGETTELDIHFERMWNGKDSGFSETHFTSRVAELRRSIEHVNTGQVNPSRIIGSGHRNPKTSALQYLERQIAASEVALATRGRSDAVNYSNARYRIRQSPADPDAAHED